MVAAAPSGTAQPSSAVFGATVGLEAGGDTAGAKAGPGSSTGFATGACAIGSTGGEAAGAARATERFCGVLVARTGGGGTGVASAGAVVVVVVTGSGATVGITIVAAGAGGVVMVGAGATATGASVTGTVTSCACAVPAESISMAEIAMVLRGDMVWSVIMTGKRDEMRFGFGTVDETRQACPRVAATCRPRKNVSLILNNGSSLWRSSWGVVWRSVKVHQMAVPLPHGMIDAAIDSAFDFAARHTYMAPSSNASSKVVPCAGDGSGRKRKGNPSDARGCGPWLPLNGMSCAVRPFTVWWRHHRAWQDFRRFSGSN